MELDSVIAHGKTEKALEFCNVHKTEMPDRTHQHLHIEITTKRLPAPLGIKPFICCSTLTEPNQHVGNHAKSLLGKTLQASWN